MYHWTSITSSKQTSAGCVRLRHRVLWNRLEISLHGNLAKWQARGLLQLWIFWAMVRKLSKGIFQWLLHSGMWPMQNTDEKFWISERKKNSAISRRKEMLRRDGCYSERIDNINRLCSILVLYYNNFQHRWDNIAWSVKAKFCTLSSRTWCRHAHESSLHWKQ